MAAKLTDVYEYGSPVYGHYGNSYPAKISDWSFMGFSAADMQTLAVLDPGQYGGEMSELDDAGTYFDLGLRQCSAQGVYNYLCTRNNNFSNRSQQAQAYVMPASVGSAQLDGTSNSYSVSGVTITTQASGTTLVQTVEIIATPPESTAGFDQSGISSASDIACLGPFVTDAGMIVKLSLTYDANPLKSFDFVRADRPAGPWDDVDGATYEDGVATATITQGGCYCVQSSPNAGVITGIVLACLAVTAGIGAGVWYKFFRGKSTNFKNKI